MCILLFHLISFMIGRTQIIMKVHSRRKHMHVIFTPSIPYQLIHRLRHKQGHMDVWLWSNFYGIFNDLFVCAPSQWETMLQCNVVFHWLGAFIKWSLYIMGSVGERFITIISYIKEEYKNRFICGKQNPLHGRYFFVAATYEILHQGHLWDDDHVQHAKI